MKRRTGGSLALAALLAATLAPAAWAATQETSYEWSMDLDCALCHQKEAEGLAPAEADETKEAEAEPIESDTDEKGAGATEVSEGLAPAEADETKEAEAEPIESDTDEKGAGATEVSAYAAMHVQTFGLECVACHSDEEGLAVGHKNLNSGKEARRLKKSKVDSEVCTTCHKAEDLAGKTADYRGLTDSNGTVVNPHDLPQVESHQSIACTDCHQAHSGKQIDFTAATTCNSCHHAGVYECNTCH